MKIVRAIFFISLTIVSLSAQTAEPSSADNEDRAGSGEKSEPPASHFSSINETSSKEAIARQLASWRFNEDVFVQGELIKVFKERYPGLLTDALKSSGNMHNPKVLPLRTNFSECLLMTPTISRINGILRAKGYTAAVANLEKFEIQKDDPELPFNAIIWLETQPLADAPSRPEGDKR